jgi:ribose 1,5-bisphosphokinase
MASGMIVLVVGPSGAGKDTILHYAATKLAQDRRFVFPRRVITRLVEDATEHHEGMTVEAFQEALRQGRFALHWEAHGFHYGIPSSIEDDLAAGRTIAINVSRSILAQAVRRYPNYLIANVAAPAAALLERLARRGREPSSEIAARVTRNADPFPEGAKIVTIVNDRSPAKAGENFIRVLKEAWGNPVS